MTALAEFLKRNQISKSNPLPLMHTTEGYHVKKIIGSRVRRRARSSSTAWIREKVARRSSP